MSTIAKSSAAGHRSVDRSTEIAAQQATIARLRAEKQGEIQTQQATIARQRAKLRNAATSEEQRHSQLYQEGAISASTSDSKKLATETAQQQLNEAQAKLNQIQESRQQQIIEAAANLDRIAEVRPVDVQAASAEVSSAQANLALAYIHSPRDAQVLKIQTYSVSKKDEVPDWHRGYGIGHTSPRLRTAIAMGFVVGVIIVYQVLSTDVSDQMAEYATFKAMGYRGTPKTPKRWSNISEFPDCWLQLKS